MDRTLPNRPKNEMTIWDQSHKTLFAVHYALIVPHKIMIFCAIPGIFCLYFRLFNAVDSKQMFNISLPMTGFKQQISESDGAALPIVPQPLPHKIMI